MPQTGKFILSKNRIKFFITNFTRQKYILYLEHLQILLKSCNSLNIKNKKKYLKIQTINI